MLPILDAEGHPSCPLCGNNLIYVEETLMREEYLLTGAGKPVDNSTDKFLPKRSEEGEQIPLEVFKRHIECSTLECEYYLDEDSLGETLI